MASGPKLVEETIAQARQCESANALNRLHIDIEDVATPSEIAALAARRTELPEATQTWLGGLAELAPSLMAAPQRFIKTDHHPALAIFNDPDVPSDQKSALLAFAGAAGRLMLPLPVFLQFFPADRWSVIKLTGHGRKNYLNGIHEFADSLEELVAIAGRAGRLDQHRQIVTMGTSSGGFAALAAATMLKAHRGVSIGGFVPRLDDDALARRSKQLGLPKGKKSPADLRIIFGHKAALDRTHARKIRKLTGGQLVPVAELRRHNVLFALLQRGELAGFVDRLDGEWPT